MWPSAMGYSSIQMPEEQSGRGFVARSAKFLNTDTLDLTILACKNLLY